MTMSEEDLELVRELNRAFNDRDRAWLDLFDPGAEVHLPPGLPGEQVYAGLSDIERAASLWTTSVEDYHWEMHELIDAGDCMVGLFRFRSQVNAHTSWLAPPFGAVFYMRAGRIARVLTFFSWEEAMRAAGLQASRTPHG
jgi:ketosteroid isomerase-like protein